MAEVAEARPAEDAASAAEHGAAPVDVQQLAERVYRLLVREARLGRARGERIGQARR